jgi:imidazolonepropionase
VSHGYAAPRVVTCDPRRTTPDNPLGVIENGAVLVEDERVAWVGRRADLPRGAKVTLHDGSLLTPGLVDAHTHACWAGSRHAEYAVRMSGGDYEAIARAGGGILSTHRAVAAATEEELALELEVRLRRMARLGVTCVEIKSGYGLLPEHEEKQLRAIARAASNPLLPKVVPTFLGLHALPPGVAREEFVVRVAEDLVPRFAGLYEYFDAYVDRNAFSVEEARLAARAAKNARRGVRLHVGQFADVGGAELCAELGAASADHLENVSEEGAKRLAAAGVHAVLLPVASFTLGQSPPKVAWLRAAGVPLVVASDANPGTAPTESLPLAVALAVRTYGLSSVEAILGVTRIAAASLGKASLGELRGVLQPGARADLVVWDLPHELALLQPWGTARTRLVVRDGRALFSS